MRFKPSTRACKLCGAAIFFAQSQTGNPMPLDVKQRRIVVLDERGDFIRMEAGYESHYATCPNADAFRKGR